MDAAVSAKRSQYQVRLRFASDHQGKTEVTSATGHFHEALGGPKWGERKTTHKLTSHTRMMVMMKMVMVMIAFMPFPISGVDCRPVPN